MIFFFCLLFGRPFASILFMVKDCLSLNHPCISKNNSPICCGSISGCSILFHRLHVCPFVSSTLSRLYSLIKAISLNVLYLSKIVLL